MVAPNETLRIRDRMLEELLYAVGRTPILHHHLVLGGGAAMHFVYSSPRYSEDIDFVTLLLQDQKQDIITALQTLGGPHTCNVKDKGMLVRASYRDSASGVTAKIEIQQCPAHTARQLTGKFSPLNVEHPNEIVTDKIVASVNRLHARGSIKPSDLFDITFLKTTYGAHSSLPDIQQKAADYRFNITMNDLEKLAAFIADPAHHDGFINSIKPTLSSDVFTHIPFNRDYFERSAILIREAALKTKNY